MDDSRLREFVERQTWKYSKTYAKTAPHEYIVRDNLKEGEDQDFVFAVLFIREYGVPMDYWKRHHIYYRIDDKLYWTMGNPVEETTVLNRCNISDYNIWIRTSNDIQKH